MNRRIIVLLGSIGLLLLIIAGLDNAFSGNLKNEEKQHVANQVTKLVVKDSNTKVHLRPTEADELSVKYVENQRSKYSIEQNGGELSIRKATSFRLLTLNFNAKSYDLVIDVPETWILEIDITSSNSPIVIEQLETKDLSTKTSNGPIIFHEIYAKTLDVQTSNGSIEAEKVEVADWVQMKTSNSGIRLKEIDIRNQLSATSSNGDIYLRLLGSAQDYRIDCKTSNGECRVPTGNQGNKMIDLKTSNGNVNIDFSE